MRAQVIDASQAKAETWLNDEYELNPKIRDVREHGAPARRSWGAAASRVTLSNASA